MGGGGGLRELYFLIGFAKSKTAQKSKVDLIKKKIGLQTATKDSAVCLSLISAHTDTFYVYIHIAM